MGQTIWNVEIDETQKALVKDGRITLITIREVSIKEVPEDIMEKILIELSKQSK